MKNEKRFSTIQVDSFVKEQIVDYCSRHDLKIGRFIQRLFLCHVSSSDASTSNEITPTLLFDSFTSNTPPEDHAEFVRLRSIGLKNLPKRTRKPRIND